MPDNGSSLPPNRGLRAALRGCRTSLTRLVGRIGNRHDVDDLLQEAFMRSYEAAGKSAFRNPRAFLLRTASNLAFNSVPRPGNKLSAKKEDLTLPEVYQLATETAEPHLDTDQRFVSFCRAIGGLPEQCRRAFILKKVYGLNQQDIADRLGITSGLVEKHIAHGLMMCRDYLESASRPGSGGGQDPRKSGHGPRA